MKTHLTLITLVAILLAACTTDAPENNNASGKPKANQTAAAGPAATLVGEWHNNTAGATKVFKKDGTVFGFWPLGGSYRVLSQDAAKRSLKLTCSADEAGGDQPKQTFTATVSFSANGKLMTFESVSGEGGPEKGLVFYRTR